MNIRPISVTNTMPMGSLGSWGVRTFDFAEPGKTATPQNKGIYAISIISRLAVARGYNEIGEICRRDMLGWLFWFYTTPLIQRAVIACAPAKVRSALLRQTPRPRGSGMLTSLNWTLNPITRWHLASSAQIMDYIRNPRLKSQLSFLNQLRRWRAGASAVGILAAFFALGVGINLINIAVTRNNVLSGKTGPHLS